MKTDLEDLMLPTDERFDEILDVHLALVDLAKFDPELADLVEMVYFGGCPIKTAAEIRGVATKTISRHLELAEKWLQTRMSCPPALEKAALHEEPLVREHAAWAVRRILGRMEGGSSA